jgi:hypothetical protein
MLRIPHCLDSRLTDGGTVVSPAHRPHFTPHKHFWYSFMLEAEWIPGPSVAGRIKLIEKLIYFVGSRTRDLLACSTVPQLLHYRFHLYYSLYFNVRVYFSLFFLFKKIKVGLWSRHPVSFCVCARARLVVARQLLGKHVPLAPNKYACVVSDTQ